MKVFRGSVVHATATTPLEVREDQLLGVQDGKVIFLEDGCNLSHVREKYDLDLDHVTQLAPDEFLMPGLVDAHIHASQYPQTGTHLDLPLLDWLQHYTFPLEARFADPTFAKAAYRKVVNRVLRNGTTTACYFATIHLEGTLQLCSAVEEFGQRAFLGKVNMDSNAPKFYIEDTRKSLDDTKLFVEAVLNKKNDLLTPVVTPRFAVSCTEELLRGLGEIAKEYSLPVQSHISENKAECKLVKDRFPDRPTYASVYDSFGLLNSKTVMAHGVYLNNEELRLFHDRGAGICHCPNSNLSIRSGMLDVRNVANQGVKLGLGTDVSGGYAPSMLDALRMAVTTSNALSLDQGTDYKVVDFREAFKLATLGGAQVLGLEERIGNFHPGKEFDALRINISSSGSPVDVSDLDTMEDKVQKFLFLGDDRNIREVYVAGKQVVTQR